MKIPLQSRKRGSTNERLHLFAKDEKGYPFYQLALVATRRKRVPFFYQFCCHSKRLARVSKTPSKGSVFLRTPPPQNILQTP